ncbi:MAG: Ig-like domain-containing protein [Methylococcaceae bacterium]
MLTAKAYDAAGNMGVSAPVTFVIHNAATDTDPPIVSVSERGDIGAIIFNATATDNIGVIKVEFYVDGVLKGTDATSPYSMVIDSLILSNGAHTLIAKAFDVSGNVGNSESVAFNVNNAPPVPTTYNEIESNGGIGSANAVAAVVTKIVGYLGNSTDQDFFMINVAAGYTVTVNMMGPAKDYDLYLLNNKGFMLKASFEVGSTESVSYKNSGSTTATYLIKVIAFGGAYTTSTPYNLVLSR